MSALRAVRPDERQPKAQAAAEWTHPVRLVLVVAGSWVALGLLALAARAVWRWAT